MFRAVVLTAVRTGQGRRAVRVPSAVLVSAWCVLAVVGLGGCANDFALKRVGPAPSEKRTAVALASASAATAQALQTLAATSGADARPETLEKRRQATGRIVDLYGPALLRDRQHVVTAPLSGGRSVRLRLRRGKGKGGLDPGKFVGLEPADHFVVTTRAKLAHVEGTGAPLVGTLPPVKPIGVEDGPVRVVPVAGLTWVVTAVPVLERSTGDGETLDINLYNPYKVERVPAATGERTLPLAADFTAPLAVTTARIEKQGRGLRGFLNGGSKGDYASTGIYVDQPPDPEKIPLVLVHGLISDPSAFHLLHANLMSDPEVQRHYQVCFFYYPSSLPVPYSAMLLRDDLEKFIHGLDPGGNHPAMHRVVLVGHSMGGMLVRLTVSSGGDRYYHHFFSQDVDQLKLTPDQRKLIRRAFYYEASPDVAQVVFIATPHRGAKLAGSILGSLGRLIVRLPVAVKGRLTRILTVNSSAVATGVSIKSASSMSSLTPKDPLVAAINDMPLRPGLGIHSVVGNRGRPGPLERSSDGVVPYASSHLPQAQSQVVVPAGHSGTLGRPETAKEILRILKGPASGG